MTQEEYDAAIAVMKKREQRLNRFLERTIIGFVFCGGVLLSVNPTGTITPDTQLWFAGLTTVLGLVLIRAIRRGAF